MPKIVAAMQLCLNNALKGDLKALTKIMELVDKYGWIQHATSPKPEVMEIRRVIVDPKTDDIRKVRPDP
jgi:hypothetical protein